MRNHLLYCLLAMILTACVDGNILGTKQPSSTAQGVQPGISAPPVFSAPRAQDLMTSSPTLTLRALGVVNAAITSVSYDVSADISVFVLPALHFWRPADSVPPSTEVRYFKPAIDGIADHYELIGTAPAAGWTLAYPSVSGAGQDLGMDFKLGTAAPKSKSVLRRSNFWVLNFPTDALPTLTPTASLAIAYHEGYGRLISQGTHYALLATSSQEVTLSRSAIATVHFTAKELDGNPVSGLSIDNISLDGPSFDGSWPRPTALTEVASGSYKCVLPIAYMRVGTATTSLSLAIVNKSDTTAFGF